MANINELSDNGKGIGILAVVVIVVLAVLQGMQNTGSLGSGNLTNTSVPRSGAFTAAVNFTSGLGEFGTFATVIVLAIVGFFIINMVSKE